MIHSFERQEMLLNGIWRPQNQFAEAGRFGYHINSLYSILGNETSLGSIAIKFLLAKGLKSELQNFVNGWLAEPWDESEAYENRQVKLEVFKAEEIPTEDALPIMGVDCQEGHFWAVVRLFAPPSKEKPFGESWLLFADRVDTEDELAEVQKDYKVKGENVLCDMAHRPNQVGKMILERDWRGIWGSPTTKQYYHPQEDGTRVSRPYSVVQFRDPMMGTAWQNRTFQRARYVLFSKDAVLDMVSSLRYAEPSIWHITANCSPRYARHLNSRIKVQHQNNRNGRIEWIWKELHQENHLADAENFVTVRALQHGMIILPGEVGTAITGGTLGL